MAAPVRISEETVLEAALDLVRGGGPEALNARALARALNCSTQPIFRCFGSMEELRRAVLVRALEVYHAFCRATEDRGLYPPYKARGMAYVGFGLREPALFRLLFMRSRDGEPEAPEAADWAGDTALAGAGAGLAPASAELFHLEMWAFVHGVAAMGATGYLRLEEETVSRMLTDAYQGLRQRWEASADQKSERDGRNHIECH